MHTLSSRRSDDGIVEHDIDPHGVPGLLWVPESASRQTPAPLILMGHPGGLRHMRPRLLLRARRAAADGFATAALELPGAGGRRPLVDVDRARRELRRRIEAGASIDDELVDRLIAPLVSRAVPEWRSALDAVLRLPEIADGPVGVSGGVTAIGVRMAAVDPRVAALGLFAGSYVPRATLAEARGITTPLHMLLQWDDAGNDRDLALELFDAFGSSEKTLQANLGGHTGVPAHAGEDAARFFQRHLARTV
ncbi:alpha/beta hydrolase [Leucobacter allii]|uniref:alpha/beta hydrolase n=1 Tax=Leucobacter allii TaxID=2932247 RepID=UPI001FD4C163|nr:alpha/beta hydrolase [Leucobacter allii]UOR03047.1 alpha/beta hydrolase [Leucobacter allii]